MSNNTGTNKPFQRGPISTVPKYAQGKFHPYTYMKKAQKKSIKYKKKHDPTDEGDPAIHRERIGIRKPGIYGIRHEGRGKPMGTQTTGVPKKQRGTYTHRAATNRRLIKTRKNYMSPKEKLYTETYSR